MEDGIGSSMSNQVGRPAGRLSPLEAGAKASIFYHPQGPSTTSGPAPRPSRDEVAKCRTSRSRLIFMLASPTWPLGGGG